MTRAPSTVRAHLIERAVDALGGPAGLDLLAPHRPAEAARATPGTPILPGPPAAVPAQARPEASAAAAAIPMSALLRAGLVAAPDGVGRSLATEEIAVVQLQVLRAVEAAPPATGRCGRVVLVTSARPGEGKTFTALNLAAGIAQGGRWPVVLVDADGKRSSITDLLGQADAPGLRGLVADAGRTPASLLVPTEIDGLALLPCGAAPPQGRGSANPLPGAAVSAAILRLAAALPGHVIVLDAPPCLSTSDPGALATVAGQVLMVVEAERTQRSEVESALDMVEACPTLHLVLNRMRLAMNDGFGAYGDYGGQGADAGA